MKKNAEGKKRIGLLGKKGTINLKKNLLTRGSLTKLIQLLSFKIILLMESINHIKAFKGCL